MGMQAGDEEDAITEINVTPLVDVCLVLVIIFMVTAPLLMHPSLDVILPKATTAKGDEKENVTITITKDGKIALNADEMTWEILRKRIRNKIEESSDKFVIIRADEGALYGEVIEAMSIAKEAGAKSLSIATEQKKR